MIVEVRSYTVRPGLRDRFLDFFQHQSVPLQQSLGMGIVGPLVDTQDRDAFIWLRAFPSSEERDRMRAALYEGEKWKNELQAIALPMLDRYSSVLTRTPPWFVHDLLASPEPARTARTS